jgi:hypothetical protein
MPEGLQFQSKIQIALSLLEEQINPRFNQQFEM